MDLCQHECAKEKRTITLIHLQPFIYISVFLRDHSKFLLLESREKAQDTEVEFKI